MRGIGIALAVLALAESTRAGTATRISDFRFNEIRGMEDEAVSRMRRSGTTVRQALTPRA